MALFTVSFAYWYVNSEHYFRMWDDRHYHHQAILSSRYFFQSLEHWWQFTRDWLQQDYNTLFSLPLIPLIPWLGESRAGFVTALAMVYLFPCALVMAWLGSRMLPAARAGIMTFMVLALFGVTLPAPWYPTLDGLPGVGGAALFLLAMVIYVHHLQRPRWWHPIAVGTLVGAAILFRRHFGYAAVALYAAILLEGGFTTRGTLWSFTRWSVVGFLAIAGTVQLGVMFAVAPAFTLRSLSNTHTALYASFRRSPWENLQDILATFGGGFIVLGLVGLWWALRDRQNNPRPIVLLLLYLVIWLLLWIFLVRVVTTHTSLHALLPAVALGNGFLCLYLWQSAGRWRALAVLLAAFFLGHFAFVFSAPTLPPYTWLAKRAPLVATPQPPPQIHRQDHDNYIRLVKWLRDTLPADSRIYVAASSHQFNDSLLISIEETHWGHEGGRLSFLPAAVVDSRDYLPISVLTLADTVIVANPVQTTLPTEQQVVRVAAELFLEGSAFGEDFVELSPAYEFETGFQVHVYQRRRPTDVATASRTITRMLDALGFRPALQADWMALEHHPGLSVTGIGAGNTTLGVALHDRQAHFLALASPSTTAHLRVTAHPAPGCTGEVRIAIGTVSIDGDREEILVSEALVLTRSVAVEAKLPPGYRPFLRLQPGDHVSCQLTLHPVVDTAG